MKSSCFPITKPKHFATNIRWPIFNTIRMILGNMNFKFSSDIPDIHSVTSQILGTVGPSFRKLGFSETSTVNSRIAECCNHVCGLHEISIDVICPFSGHNVSNDDTQGLP
ncbi:hypothetical protein CEXT_631321 [Caerostris extrusa]|uniref:Uncharacterized protein n=1 Tax=Caerostris extrusa TaxID=172846 RepID=A0AAV4YAN1_CAEEX|nr:hypothetical protein CEXT_631321 [Caerostris extrusa]